MWWDDLNKKYSQPKEPSILQKTKAILEKDQPFDPRLRKTSLLEKTGESTLKAGPKPLYTPAQFGGEDIEAPKLDLQGKGGLFGRVAEKLFNIPSAAVTNVANKFSDLFDFEPAYSEKEIESVLQKQEKGEKLSYEDSRKLVLKKQKIDTPVEALGGELKAGSAIAGLIPSWLIVSTELEAAKEVPILKYPAQAISKIFEGLGKAGSFVMGKGVDVLPISDESKQILREPLQEVAATIAQIGGAHIGFKAAEKGLGGAKIKLTVEKEFTGTDGIKYVTTKEQGTMPKDEFIKFEEQKGLYKNLPFSEKGKERIGSATKVAANIAMKPLRAPAELFFNAIKTKLKDRQDKGIPITPPVSKEIADEAVREVPLPEKPSSVNIPTSEGTVKLHTNQRSVLKTFIKGQEDLDYKQAKTLGKDIEGNPIEARFEWDYKNQKGIIYTTNKSTASNLAHEMGHYFDRKFSGDIATKLSDILPEYEKNKEVLNASLASYAIDKLGGEANSEQIQKTVKDLADNFDKEISSVSGRTTIGEKFADAISYVINNLSEAKTKIPEVAQFVEFSLRDKGILADKVEEVANQSGFLKDLQKAKREYVSDYLKSREGEKIKTDIELRKEELAQSNKEIIQGIRNNPYVRKEGALKDVMGEGWLMEKRVADKKKGEKSVFVVAESDLAKEYESKGWERVTEIDSLAAEYGFENGYKYLEYMKELGEKAKLSNNEEKLAEKELYKNDPNYKNLVDKINEIKQYEESTRPIIERNVLGGEEIAPTEAPRGEETKDLGLSEEQKITAENNAIKIQMDDLLNQKIKAQKELDRINSNPNLATDRKLSRRALILKSDITEIDIYRNVLRKKAGDIIAKESLIAEAKKFETAEEFINNYQKEKQAFISQKAKEELVFQKGYQSKTSAARKKAYDIAEMEWEIKTKELYGKKLDIYNEKSQLTDIWNEAQKGIEKPAEIPKTESVEKNPTKAKTVEDLVENATKYNDEFKKGVENIGNLGGWEVKHGPVKTVERLNKKLLEEGESLETMRDANRSTVIIKNPKELNDVVRSVEKQFGEKTRLKDKFNFAVGEYRSAIVNIKTPYGHEAEVAVTTPEYWKAKTELGGQELYEIERVKGPGFEDAVRKRIKLYTESERRLNLRLDSSVKSEIAGTGLKTGENVRDRLSYNPDKINAPEDVETLIKGVSAAGKEFKEQRISKSDENLKALAQEVGISVDDLLKAQPGSIANAETVLKSRQIVMDMAQDLRDTLKNTGDSATPEQLQAIKDKLFRLQGTMKAVAGFRTEASNVFRQFKIEALAGENDIMSDLVKQLKKIDADSAGDISKFIKGSKELLEPTTADKAWHLWYMSILSGESTQIKNAFGNFTQMVGELVGVAARKPAELPFAIEGLFNGLYKGWSEGKTILKEGRVSKMEEGAKKMPVVFRGKWSFLNYADYVGRFMSAVDAFAREGFRGMEASGIAREQASKEGYTGDALKQRVEEIKNNLTEEQQKQVEQFSSQGVYTQNPEGAIGWVSQKVSEITRKVPGGKLIVPFTRIVANVTNNSLNWTPLGIKRALVKPTKIGDKTYFKEGGFLSEYYKDPLTTRQRQQALTRGVLGTLAMAYFATLANDEKLSGNGPTDYRKRQQLKDSGWRENSIKIGDTWYPYQNWGPMAISMTLVGNFFDSSKYASDTIKEEDLLTRAGLSIAGSANSILNMSFLSGVADLFEFIKDPIANKSYIKNFIAQQATSPVPNLVKQTARYFDTTIYETKTIKDKIFSNLRITGGLNPKLNVFGQPIKGEALTELQPTKESDDPLIRFLSDNDIYITVAGRTAKVVDKSGQKREMTDDEYYEYVKNSGQEIYRVLTDRLDYIKKMKDEEQRKKYIDSIIDDARTRAKWNIR